MDGNRLLTVEALVKIIAFEHAGHRIAGGQLDQIGGSHRSQPLGVEHDAGPLRVEDLEDLLFVGFGIFQDLFASQRLARLALARGVADHAGEVTDQKIDLMPQLLELLELLDQHRVTEMQVRCRGIEAGLDAQGLLALRGVGQLLLEFALDQDLHRPAADDLHLLLDRLHDIPSLAADFTARTP